jgi:hypothetical protein
MSCEYENRCLNSEKCYRCFDQVLLKLPGDKKRSNPGRTKIFDSKKAGAKDSWKILEQDTADELNNIPTIKEARRSRASGALWFEKGDVVDEILHPENKERTGRQLKSGERSMSIQKGWLDKAREEARSTNKVMCLPFAFKGDPHRYAIIELEDLASLVTHMKAYMHDNECQRLEIEALKKKIQQLESNRG